MPTPFSHGSRTQIQVQAPGSTFRVPTLLLGAVEDHYLVLRNARAGDDELARLNTRVGETLIGRFISDGTGTVVGFRTPVLLLMQEPERLLFVAYPKTFEQHALRSHQRITCSLPCQVEIEGVQEPGLILDLSDLGCQCSVAGADRAVETGQLVSLGFRLPDSDGLVTLKGRVRRVATSGVSSRFGMVFEEPNPDATAAIGRYVALAG